MIYQLIDKLTDAGFEVAVERTANWYDYSDISVNGKWLHYIPQYGEHGAFTFGGELIACKNFSDVDRLFDFVVGKFTTGLKEF